MTDESAELQLIALVHSRPVLWDKSSEEYRNPVRTKAAWNEICRKLNEDYDFMSQIEQEIYYKDVIKKWTNIRDAMVKSLRRGRRYIYGEQLQFLTRLYATDPLEDVEKEVEEDSQHAPVVTDSEQLIACVKKWPCLWNKSIGTYKERTHTTTAWLAIARELNPDFDQLEASDQEHYRKEIIKKWNNMRDTFGKSLKKSSSNVPFKTRKYVYADQMHFLKKFYNPRTDEQDTVDAECGGQGMDDELEDPPHVSPLVVLQENIEEAVSMPWELLANGGAAEEESAPWQEQPNQELPACSSAKKRKMKEQPNQPTQPDDVDHRVLSLLERLQPDNRHMSFFKGILPSLEGFDEDEVLQFQSQVLQIVRNMREQKRERLKNPNSNS